MKNRVLAWFNLAWRFNRHMVTRVPRRALGGGGDFVRFAGAVTAEGYLPLTTSERATMPAAMRCVHCGLCGFAGAAAGAAGADADSAGARAGQLGIVSAGPDSAPGTGSQGDGGPARQIGSADRMPPAYSAWEEPWSFVAGASRSLERAPLVGATLPAGLETAARLCPTGVPIAALGALHRRLARATTPDPPATADSG
jgi:hypothetical protein